MPAVTASTNTKVLVTGANGYIAVWTVQTLLEKGYSVRGTVRSAEKGAYLSKLFAKYGDMFEVVVVDDITKDGAFEEAVKGVRAIEHMASPVTMNAIEPDELIGPAVKGTIGVLQSATKNGSSVQRIVVTSSCASVKEVTTEPKLFTELDWNAQSIREVEKDGAAAPAASKYRASKTLAERAAWDFVEKNKGSIKWDLAVLCPPFVFGPVIHEVASLATLNTSSKQFYNAVVKEDSGGLSKAAATVGGNCYIDVRDLRVAHVLAIETPDAGGERVIISAGAFVWQDFIDTANALSPSPIPTHTLPKGFPGEKHQYFTTYNTAKEEKLLGIKKKTMEETTRDSLADFHAQGW